MDGNLNWQELEKLIYRQERINSILEILLISVTEGSSDLTKQIDNTLMEVVEAGDEITAGLRKCLKDYLKEKQLNKKANTEITIHRGGNKTFCIRDVDTKNFGICIAEGADLIKVFQFANKQFKEWKALGLFETGDCHE